MGLLIESIIWNGLAIDKDFKVWQVKEEPISILHMPYQDLKKQIHMAATRARTIAEWQRESTTRMEDLIEIDRKASVVNPDMDEEDKGIVKNIQCGGSMGKQYISTFNDAYEEKCNYCRNGPSTGMHIRWECAHFEPIRQETDKALAEIPRKYLSDPIKCGIGPAMVIDDELAFWGTEVDSNEKEEIKKILGVNLELRRGGEDGDETRRRKKAAKLIDDPKRGNRNARQTMLKHKQAHGSGCMPTFPTEQDINVAMEGHNEDHMIQAYGDGSMTTPTNWWAGLGGFGAWIPNWNLPGQEKEHRKEQDLHGPTLGQTGTSTRHELMAWIAILAEPVRVMYATDSAAMLTKAKQLLSKAKQREEARASGKPVKAGCPFKKPWRLQTDGDLWEVAWEAIHKRGIHNQDLRKVKGHATHEDVRNGTSTKADKEGNDRNNKVINSSFVCH